MAGMDDDATTSLSHYPADDTESNIDRDDDNTKAYKIYRLIKTCMFIIAWISQGMFDQITGSTVLDLMYRASTNYEGVSYAIAVMNISRAVGSLCGGFVLDRLRKFDDILTAASLFCAAVGVVMKPWSGNVIVLGLSFVIQGLAKGWLNTVVNAVLVKTWRRKASQALFIMHTGYPVGMFIAPLIVRPFLGSSELLNNSTGTDGKMNYSASLEMTNNQIHSISGLNGTIYETNHTVTRGGTYFESQIEIPYLILTGILVLNGFSFVALYCFRPSTNEEKFTKTLKLREMFNPRSCADGDMLYGSSMCALLALFAVSFKLFTEPIRYYLFTFAVTSELKLPKQNAALLDSMQGVGQAVGRLVSAGLKRFLPIKVILISSLYACLCITIVMTFFSLKGEVYLWFFAILFSFSSGPVWPATMGWIDHYLVVTGIVVALSDIASAIGGFVAQWIVGIVLENQSAISIMYTTWCASAVSCIFVVMMQFIGAKHGSRYTKDETCKNDNNS